MSEYFLFPQYVIYSITKKTLNRRIKTDKRVLCVYCFIVCSLQKCHDGIRVDPNARLRRQIMQIKMLY